MNYRRIYREIIDRRRVTTPSGYSEKHHIVPRSLGGDNSKDNIVVLTAREHFICHWLLYKMYNAGSYECHKMTKAFMLMLRAHTGKHERYVSRMTGRVFEKLRVKFAEAMSVAQTGGNNSQLGTKWIYCEATDEVRKLLPGETIPEGWSSGRTTKYRTATCVICSVKFKALKKSGRKTCSEVCAMDLCHTGRDRTTGNKQNKQCLIDGVEYTSVMAAANALCLGHETVRMRIKSTTFENYSFTGR